MNQLRHILFFLLLMNVVSAEGQIYESIFSSDDSSSWSVLQTNNIQQYKNYSYKVKGDTIVNGAQYKIIQTFHVDTTLNSHPNSFFLLRQDDSGRVWYRDLTLQTQCDTLEYCIMDFSLQIGDTFIISPYLPDSLQIVENVYSLGNNREAIVFKLINPFDNQKVMFIEGVGCTMGLRYRSSCQFQHGYDLSLLCMKKGLWLEYQNQYFFGACYPFGIPPSDPSDTTTHVQTTLVQEISIYPNPASNQLEIIGHKGSYSYIITNLVGQELLRGIKLSNDSQIVDVSNLNTGLFLFRLNSGIQSKVLPFFKL